MCPSNTNTCGDKTITVQKDGSYETREIRGLYQGETCNYRVKADCGAPVFEPVPGGEWSSSLDHFNITFVEFEEVDIELAGTNLDNVEEENKWMPLLGSKFIY